MKCQDIIKAPTVSQQYRDQLKAMTDHEIVEHRKQLIQSKKDDVKQYWGRMWSVNAEMARRFAKGVKR